MSATSLSATRSGNAWDVDLTVQVDRNGLYLDRRVTHVSQASSDEGDAVCLELALHQPAVGVADL